MAYQQQNCKGAIGADSLERVKHPSSSSLPDARFSRQSYFVERILSTVETTPFFHPRPHPEEIDANSRCDGIGGRKEQNRTWDVSSARNRKVFPRRTTLAVPTPIGPKLGQTRRTSSKLKCLMEGEIVRIIGRYDVFLWWVSVEWCQ